MRSFWFKMHVDFVLDTICNEFIRGFSTFKHLQTNKYEKLTFQCEKNNKRNVTNGKKAHATLYRKKAHATSLRSLCQLFRRMQKSYSYLFRTKKSVFRNRFKGFKSCSDLVPNKRWRRSSTNSTKDLNCNDRMIFLDGLEPSDSQQNMLYLNKIVK